MNNDTTRPEAADSNAPDSAAADAKPDAVAPSNHAGEGTSADPSRGGGSTPDAIAEAEAVAQSAGRTEDDDRDVAAEIRDRLLATDGERQIVDVRAVFDAMNNGVEIKGCNVDGPRCRKQTFDKAVMFEGCELRKLDFNRCVFKGKVVFRHCVIDRPSLFGATFEAGVEFNGCEFKYTTVRNVTVSGKCSMPHCTIVGAFRVDGCTFDTFDTWEANFLEWADFKGTTFNQNADFRSADFESGFAFKRCHFKCDLLLRGTAVAKKLEFADCTFDRSIDLSKSKLRDFTYFTDNTYGPDCTFAFQNMIAQALLLRPETIDGRLASERAGDHAAAAAEYGVLKNNYQSQNWLDEEDWAYYRFKKAQRAARAKAHKLGPIGSLGRLMEWFIFDVACAYGTKPSRVLITAACTILFFAICYLPAIFGGGNDASPLIDVYTITGVEVVDGILTAGIDSTSAFVSGFDGVDKNVEGWPVLLLTIESLAGMLLLGLFIVSFSRKVIR